MSREGVRLPVIQRRLGHAHLGVTSTYLQDIDTTEIINTIHARKPPTIPASAGLRL
jgi:integrase